MTLLAAHDLRAQAREWIDRQGWSQTTQPAGAGHYRSTITGPGYGEGAPDLQASATGTTQEGAVELARLELLHQVESAIATTRSRFARPPEMNTRRVPGSLLTLFVQ